jgi:hypothetical protein
MEETNRQIRDFIEYWKIRRVDRVGIKLAGNWHGKISPCGKHKTMTFSHRPCRDIFHKCTILADGMVVPCCVDIEGELPLGNILK